MVARGSVCHSSVCACVRRCACWISTSRLPFLSCQVKTCQNHSEPQVRDVAGSGGESWSPQRSATQQTFLKLLKYRTSKAEHPLQHPFCASPASRARHPLPSSAASAISTHAVEGPARDLQKLSPRSAGSDRCPTVSTENISCQFSVSRSRSERKASHSACSSNSRPSAGPSPLPWPCTLGCRGLELAQVLAMAPLPFLEQGICLGSLFLLGHWLCEHFSPARSSMVVPPPRCGPRSQCEVVLPRTAGSKPQQTQGC